MVSSVTEAYSYSSSSLANSRVQSIVPAESLNSQPATKIVDRTQVPSSSRQTSNNPEPGNADRNNTAVSQKTSSKQATDSRENDQAVQQVVNQLKARDVEVRIHEMAHLAAAGGYATSGASFSYQVGPDGKHYAIGGEVGIDVSPIAGDPQATLQKAMVVQSAALAPANPSAQDIRVASAAMQMASQARVEMTQQQEGSQEDSVEMDGDSDDSTSGSGASKDSGQVGSGQAEPKNQISQPQDNAINLQASRQEFDLRLAFQQGA